MFITNKTKLIDDSKLIDDALKLKYEEKLKETNQLINARQKEKDENKKIDKIRRLYLGSLYGECNNNPEGVSRARVEEQYNKLKREGCISGCSFKEFVKTCELKTYYADCSKDIKCIEKTWDKTSNKGKQSYNEYSSIYNPTPDLKDEVKYLRNIIEEQNKDIIDLKKKFDITTNIIINDLKEKYKKSIIFHWMYAIFVDRTIPKEDFTVKKAHEVLREANFTISYNKEFQAYLKELAAEFRSAVKDMRVSKLLEQYPLPKVVERGSDDDDIAPEEDEEEVVPSPIENGLIGVYTGESLTDKSWVDLSGYNNDAENIGSYKAYISFGNNNEIAVVKGNPGSKIIFPPSILPEIYTLISVARYTDTQRGRIFDGMTKNWLSGFWGEGTNFYHEGWVSSMNGNGKPGNNWIINIDTGDSVWSNGKDITSNSNLTISDRLTINAGFHKERESSSFEVAYVAVFDRRLTKLEIKEYNEWLSQLFNITI
jgi:hypothetical protein